MPLECNDKPTPEIPPPAKRGKNFSQQNAMAMELPFIFVGCILVGANLAWFNFRWLRQGLDVLTTAATAQANRGNPRVPIGTYFKALFRYGLIALAVYVIFKYLNVPILSMICGLCALGAATLAVSVYEILHPQE